MRVSAASEGARLPFFARGEGGSIVLLCALTAVAPKLEGKAGELDAAAA